MNYEVTRCLCDWCQSNKISKTGLQKVALYSSLPQDLKTNRFLYENSPKKLEIVFNI